MGNRTVPLIYPVMRIENHSRGSDAANETWRRGLCLMVLVFLLIGFNACAEGTVPASVTGFTHHIEFPIYNFTVNGVMGANLDRDGGGSFSCCVMLPKKWRPELVAHIEVEYDTDQGGPRPPPPRSFDVPVEEYKEPGMLHVHFYPQGKIRVVVSPVMPGHPKFPPLEGVTVRPDSYRNYCMGSPSDPICKNAPKEE